MAHAQSRFHAFPIRVLTGTLIGLGVYLLSLTSVWRTIEEASNDLRLRMRPPAPSGKEVRLVGIDDDDLKAFGNWPIGRAIHSDALKILTTLGTKQIALDILFSGPSQDPEQDSVLEKTIAESPNVILPYYYGAENPTNDGHFLKGSRYGASTSDLDWMTGSDPEPPFFRIAGGFGAVNMEPDPADEIVRRVPLFIETGDRLFPSLVMLAVMRHFGAGEDQIRIVPGESVNIVGTDRGTISIPVDHRGFYRVNFNTRLESFGPSFSYSLLYRSIDDGRIGKEIADLVQGATIVLGDVSTGSTDMVTTPIGRIPGVLVHATAIRNIIEGAHLRSLSGTAGLFGCIGLGALCGGLFGSRRISVLLATIVATLIGFAILAFFCSRQNLLAPLTPGIAIILLIGATGILLQVLNARSSEDRLKRAVTPFLDRSVLEEVIERSGQESSAERRELTILFSDIRGFTAWTEKQEPDEVTRVLNQYFHEMIPIVQRNGGTVDKIMGDGLMAFVGAPREEPDHAALAVRIATQMQAKAAELAAELASEAREPLQIGIGIHTGYVTVGSFGSREFKDYTVIGRAVNLAARVQGASPPGKILVTARTKALAGSRFECVPYGSVDLKGVQDKVELFEVVGVESVSDPTDGGSTIAGWPSD